MSKEIRNRLFGLPCGQGLSWGRFRRYVSTSGSDSNDGLTESKAWKTLAYACSQVSLAGSTIYVGSGTINETEQSVLAEGVSIKGAGATSIISSTLIDIPTIKLASVAEGTEGNQSISYIRMTGNGTTTYGAIRVLARSNVLIHHCEFEDFFNNGVVFGGRVSGSGDPTTPATGNKFYNNTVINCAGAWLTNGNLMLGGQTGMLVYNNTITQTDRGANLWGWAIKFYAEGYCRGLKIYNNTLTIPVKDASDWDFAIELFNCRGGIEIYNNTIQGSVDFGSTIAEGYIGMNDAGGYGFACKIHDNTIGQTSLQTWTQYGIKPERNITGGLYIYRNLFKNLYQVVDFSQVNGNAVENIYIYYNIFDTIGLNGGSNGACVAMGLNASTASYNNVNILNNVMYAGALGDSFWGINIRTAGAFTNLTIRNNIIQGFDRCIYLSKGTYDVVSFENNNFYGNGSNAATNLPDYDNDGITITNVTIQNNIVTIPGFVTAGTDFHLAIGSGCINTGIDVGLTEDYDEIAVADPPEIGAYEYV